MAKKTHRITAKGRTPSMPLNNPPTSKWRLANEWKKWKHELPNAYTYRLRVVDKNGNPIALKRSLGDDLYGLLYVGETGIKSNDPSLRGEKLARGVTDKTFGSKKSGHGAARKYWNELWDQILTNLSADFQLQFGWDEHNTFTMPANKNELLPQSQQKDEMITNSGKGYAMELEDSMLIDYQKKHKELPPLNTAQSPGMRDKDRKTKHTLAQDLEDRSDGKVEGV